MALAIAHRTASELDQYMNRIRRIPLLSREEEQDLARRYRDEGDAAAAERLVTANLRFVVKVALEMKPFKVGILDAVQEGNLGLLHAVRKFDPERGYRLITYAVWWIRAYIQAYLLRGMSMVRFGTTRAERRLVRQLPAAMRARGQTLDDLSSDERNTILAADLGARPSDIATVQERLAARDFSLDAVLDDDGARTLLNELVDDAEPADQVVAKERAATHLHADLQAAFATLSEREREVIRLRYLIEEPWTLREVGAHFGVSRERARQVEEAARGKLARVLWRESGAVDDLGLQSVPDALLPKRRSRSALPVAERDIAERDDVIPDPAWTAAADRPHAPPGR